MAKAVKEFLDRKDPPDEAKRQISYDNPKKMYKI
jgi:hypothetical protein